LVGLFVLGKSIVGDAAFGRLGHGGLHHLGVVTGLAAFACLATATAATPPPPAPPPLSIAVSAGFFSGGLFVGEAFALFGLDFRLHLDIEAVVIVLDVVFLRRGARCLRREQRLGRFQRVHLLAAIDDERLLAADRG